MSDAISLEELLQSKSPEKAVKKLSFEHGLELLEALVTQVEQGSLSLEQAIGSYETGVSLLGHLRSQLEGAETRLSVMQAGEKKDEEG